MFAGLPVSHGVAGGVFGAWQVIDVTSGSNNSGNATLPSYQAGDFVYLAVFLRNFQSGSYPPYPDGPTAAGFASFGDDTRQYLTGTTPNFTYNRIGVFDIGKIMQSSDTVSSVTLNGNNRRWCAVTLRNYISGIDRAVGPTDVSNATISRNISSADKPLVIGFGGSALSTTPTFTPTGNVLVDETGATATSRIITLYDPPPSSVEISWSAQAGKIIRQIDFT